MKEHKEGDEAKKETLKNRITILLSNIDDIWILNEILRFIRNMTE